MKSDTTRTYTEAQVAQHIELGLDLQKANAHASHLLLRIARLHPNHRRFKSLCSELACVAELMTLQISFCAEVADNEVSQQIECIELTLRTTCTFCEENRDLSTLEEHDNNFGPLSPSPAWATQLDSLTRLTMRVLHDIFCNSFSAGREIKKSLRCFDKLHAALRRQRRHLERITVQRAPKIVVVNDFSEVCDRCGHSYEKDGVLQYNGSDDVSENKN